MPYIGSPLPSEFLEKAVDRRMYTGDGIETFFEVNFEGENVDVFIDGTKLIPITDYTFDYENQRIALVNFPANGSKIEVIGSKSMTNLGQNSYTTESFEANEDTNYYYTIQNIDSSYRINVYLNGVRLYPPDFLVDFVYGRINFAEPLKAKDRVEVEYLKPGYRIDNPTSSLLDLSNVDPTYVKDQVLKINDTGQCYFAYSGEVPPGAVVSFAMIEPPPGWLVCDGSVLNSVDDVDYIPLYNTIGNTYGGTSGEDFNIPDLRGEFVRGWDASRGADSGRSFGSWQDWDPGRHYHSIKRISYNYIPHGHYWTYHHPHSAGDTSDYTIRSTLAYYQQSDGNWNWSTTNDGRPRNVALQYCIKY